MRLAVMASGSGSNFQAIIDAVEAGRLEAKLALCLSNNAQAGALQRAAKHGIPSAVLDPTAYDDPEAYASTLLHTLEAHAVNFIALAGYMRKIPRAVVQQFRGRMLNIHPALLPAFGGKGMYGPRIHEAVLESGVRWSGVTVHLVDEDYDTGPIVLQEPVPVHPDDDAQTLAARILRVEHTLYPEALQLFAEQRIEQHGRRVRVLPPHQGAAPTQ